MYYSTKLKVLRLAREKDKLHFVRCMKNVILACVCIAVSIPSISLATPSESTQVQETSNNEDDEEANTITGDVQIYRETHLPISGMSRYLVEVTSVIYNEKALVKEAYETEKITKVEEEVVENKPEETPEIIEEPKRENILYQVVDENGWVSTLDAKYQDYLWKMCKKYEIEDYYTLLLAQMYHESGFDIKTVSNTGDYGLMQINKCNHKWLSEKLGSNDFLDPYISIESGVLIMSDFLHKYNDVQKSLVCYNMGESAVLNGTYSTKYSTGVISDMNLLVEIQE